MVTWPGWHPLARGVDAGLATLPPPWRHRHCSRCRSCSCPPAPPPPPLPPGGGGIRVLHGHCRSGHKLLPQWQSGRPPCPGASSKPGPPPQDTLRRKAREGTVWDVAVSGARPTPAAAARGLALLAVCIALMYLLRVRAVPERCCFVWQLAAPGRSNHLRQTALAAAWTAVLAALQRCAPISCAQRQA